MRSLKDGPWCWQNKEARRRVREAFDATNNVATALAVYDALTEIASDSSSDTFTTTHAWIARISGASVRTVQNALKVFVELGLVSISTPRLRTPSTYILLSIGSDCVSTGSDCATFGSGARSPSLPTSEENKKKPEEHTEETNTVDGAAAPGVSLSGELPLGAEAEFQSKRFVPPTPEEVTTYSCEIGYQIDGQAWCDSYAQKGWMIGKAKMKDWRAAVRNWKANGWLPNGGSLSGKPHQNSTYEMEKRMHGYTF